MSKREKIKSYTSMWEYWEESPFDEVCCIHCLDEKYRNRTQNLLKELERVGLLDFSRFRIYYTVPSPYDEAVYHSPHVLKVNTSFPVACTLAHYRLIKEAYMKGHQRILIMEDDVVFLKDVCRIQEILRNMPDKDIILFDKIMGEESHWVTAKTKFRINEEYCYYASAWLASCYSLSRKGMRHIIENQEKKLAPADYYTLETDETLFDDDKPSRAMSIESICCQRDYPNYRKPSKVYNNTCTCDIDFNKYNFKG